MVSIRKTASGKSIVLQENSLGVNTTNIIPMEDIAHIKIEEREDEDTTICITTKTGDDIDVAVDPAESQIAIGALAEVM